MFKQFTITFIAFIFNLNTQAQQNHFIYIQSENKEPFYIILDGKAQYNSTITGYAIIPKLKEGKYNIEVTFVKSRAVSRANFLCSLNQRDIGYLLKYMDGKGLVLSDLQTQEITTANQITNTNVTTNTNSFGDMLADATNDPSLKNKNSSNNNKVINTTTSTNPPIISSAKQTRVIKVDQQTVDQSISITYLDVQPNGHVDTVKISIAKTNKESLSSKTGENEFPNYDTVKKTTNPIIQKNHSIDSSNTSSITIPPHKENTDIEQKSKLPIYNKNCHALAGNEEVDRLKRSLVQENSEDDMIELAKKQFFKKCFTTEQIRSLSGLFLKDATRFQFLKAAYPSIYDIDQASTLEKQLTDTYYISLFQSMLKNNIK